jgi:hypothetical protein
MDLQQKLHPTEIKTIQNDPFTASMRDVQNVEPPKVSLNKPSAPTAKTMDPVETERANKYYTGISEIYWKLNWMRRELLRGSIPYNMLDEIGTTRKSLQQMTHDGNYNLAIEALDRMEKGLEHLACLQILSHAQIDDLRVPWEAGVFAVQQQLDTQRGATETPPIPMPTKRRGYSEDTDDEDGGNTRVPALNTLPDETSGEISPQRRLAIDLALDYERQYQNSPRTMMQREWETAITRTNRLRDNLFLANRAENKDGDSTDVSRAVSLGAADYTIHVPQDAGQGGVAPAPIAIRYQ